MGMLRTIWSVRMKARSCEAVHMTRTGCEVLLRTSEVEPVAMEGLLKAAV